MAKRLKLIAALGAAVLAVIVLALLAHRSTSRTNLAKYKAALRAKGEKLTFDELGFPRTPEVQAGLTRLTSAVNQMPTGPVTFGVDFSLHFAAPGKLEASWPVPRPNFTDFSRRNSNAIDWEGLDAQLSSVSGLLAEIRAAVDQPIKWFVHDPTNYHRNPPSPPAQPYIPMRSAAQWLYADGIGALGAGDRSRALQDIHALAQLADWGKDDPMLVIQMIRNVIAGFGLNLTCEALQNPDWTEPELAALQHDWESPGLLKGLETGFLGARAFSEITFAEIRDEGSRRIIQLYFPTSSSPKPAEIIQRSFATIAWRINAPEDEYLMLRQYQVILESVRDVQNRHSWLEAQARQAPLIAELSKVTNQPTGLRKYSHYFSLNALPNLMKATQTVVRNETQRRLTIIAIALKRYEIRHHRLPASLQELTPELLATVPIDPMSGQPLGYRLNPDGTFVLYSTGEDGHDDGGDPNPPQPTAQYDFWSGRDAVWPSPGR